MVQAAAGVGRLCRVFPSCGLCAFSRSSLLTVRSNIAPSEMLFLMTTFAPVDSEVKPSMSANPEIRTMGTSWRCPRMAWISLIIWFGWSETMTATAKSGPFSTSAVSREADACTMHLASSRIDFRTSVPSRLAHASRIVGNAMGRLIASVVPSFGSVDPFCKLAPA